MVYFGRIISTKVMPFFMSLSDTKPQEIRSRRGTGSADEGAYFVYMTEVSRFRNEVLDEFTRRNYLPPMPFAAK